MKKFAIVVLSFMTAASVFAQTKTVTNRDLEKFRQERLEADKELREKYARMGITPEEVERESRRRRAEMEEYSDQLKIWRIMAENELVEQENARREYERLADQPEFVYVDGGYTPYFGYSPYGGRRHRSILPRLRNLPPNARTVQEYAIMYPNAPALNTAPTRPVRFGDRNDRFGRRPRYKPRHRFGIRIF